MQKILFFFLVAISSLFAQDYPLLEEEYGFKNNEVYAKDLFGDIENDFLLFKIPDGSNSYLVKASALIKKFEGNGILLGAKSPIVKFKRVVNTNTSGIQQHIASLFLQQYANYNFQIENLDLEQITAYDFTNKKIVKIDFTPKLLERSSGSFDIVVFDGERNRKVFFKYDIKATLDGVFTREKLSAGTSLTIANTFVKKIPFERITSPLMHKSKIGLAAVKSYAPKDTLLYENKLITNRLVDKGDKILIRVNEGGVILEFSLIALNQGGIGEIIKAKELNGKKIHQVEIIGRGLGRLL